jgi:hypothetical protein
MDFIEIQTLIDITHTRVIRSNQGTQLQIDQHRNFTTLLQCAEIRSIISYETAPTIVETDLKSLGFGSAYKGKHKVWTFRFVPDRQDVYLDTDNPIAFLINDINGVPVIKNLTETINIDKAIFDCTNTANKNTIIMAHLGTT